MNVLARSNAQAGNGNDSCSCLRGYAVAGGGLLASEALEIGHLALHLFAGGIGGGADTLDAQFEFVGVGGADQGFIEGDELLAVKVEERLIESLHAVLGAAGGDGVVNEASLVGVDDAIADVGGGDHDFNGGDAALVVGAANEALRNDGFEGGGELQTNLFLLGRREDRDDALDRFRGIESVQGRENQVAGFGGEQSGGNGFQVAHFADQDDVGVLTKGGAQAVEKLAVSTSTSRWLMKLRLSRWRNSMGSSMVMR